MLNKTAYFISVITHPIFLFFYIFLYLLFKTDIFIGIIQTYNIWRVLSYLFINSIIIPLILIFFFEKGYNLNDRKKRVLPYVIMLVIYICIYLFFYNFNFPVVMKRFLLSITIGLAVLLILNSFLKISMHTTSAGASIAFFLYLFTSHPYDYYPALIVVFIIAGLMGSSRLRLKVHGNLELYLGYFVGIVTTSIVLNIR